MKSLAELLHASGWRVSGSDLEFTAHTRAAFERLGIACNVGHNASRIPVETTLVVSTLAVSEENPELIRARELGVRTVSYPELLGEISRQIPTIAIAGTHGKTTTTALVAWILQSSLEKIAFTFGGEFSARCQPSPLQNANWFVVEACEFRQSFLQLSPQISAVLNIELDHFDCYASMPELQAAFRAFTEQTRNDGGVVDLQNWMAANETSTKTGQRFDVLHHDETVLAIECPLFGRHNRANVVAAIAICQHAGASFEQIQAGLQSFPGVRRRLEFLGQRSGSNALTADNTVDADNNVLVFDDYAHHPTAVAFTLETLRERYPDRRIVCVYQPHQVRRTRELMSGFEEAFDNANEVIIAPVFAAREQPQGEEFTASRHLADRIRQHNEQNRGVQQDVRKQRVSFVPSLDQIRATLDHACKPGDLLISMGAGDIERINNDGTGRIQRDHAS